MEHDDIDTSIQGQPQCRKNVMIVGFPSFGGISTFVPVGAFWPIVGTSAVFTAEGDIHDQNSLCQVIVSYRLHEEQ